MGCSASRPNTHFTTQSSNEDPCFVSSSSPLILDKNHIFRTHSMPTPLVHHPPLKKGDTTHLVSLTSTTYGSLVLIGNNNVGVNNPNSSFSESLSSDDDDDGPIRFSSSDSVINTWELMDGLDDEVDDRVGSLKEPDLEDRGDGFDGSVKKLLDTYEIVQVSDVVEEERKPVSKPLWKYLSEESLLAKMNPNVVSSYNRALSSRHLGSKVRSARSVECSPMHLSQHNRIGSLGASPMNYPQSKNIEPLQYFPTALSESKTVEPLGSSLLKSSQPKNIEPLQYFPSALSETETVESLGSSPLKSSQPKYVDVESSPMNLTQPTTIGALASCPMNFSQQKSVELLESSPTKLAAPKTIGSFVSSPMNAAQFHNILPGMENRIVMYLTSLRGIRKTYEDCCAVRMIFRGFRIMVDERDVSMDSAYRKELQSVLGKTAVTLPQLFIKGKYIGGAEEVKQLNEIGELGKLLEGFPFKDIGFVCKSCGDARFVPCQGCNGSRKVFEEEEGRLRRCLDCNENGLIRCPACCNENGFIRCPTCCS